MTSSKYLELGASSSKAGLHRALAAAGASSSGSYFAQMLPDQAGDDAYFSFLHCDGAGTKSIVAYLMYRETGQVSAFKGLAQDALVMNLDDAYCVGPAEGLTLANNIARNAKRIPDEIVRVLVEGYSECAEKLRALGIPIRLAGGETADMGDTVRTLVVDAVLSGRIARQQAISTDRIAAGDAIVGLSSTGQASYESKPNSGIGSNGLTLARHALLTADYLTEFPETTAPETDCTKSCRGPFRVTDTPAELGMSIGDALLSPTRSYAPVLRAVYAELGAEIHGVIHCTGGGQTKVLRFGKSLLFRKDALFPIPPIFSLIAQHGEVEAREMYQVFNMGHRLEIYLPEQAVEQVIAISREFGIDARCIGAVEKNSGARNNENRLFLSSTTGQYEYTL